MVQTIIDELENRAQFRRTMKQTIQRVMRDGAKGVKVMIKGRLNGGEIARSEMAAEGLIPLHTLRANIDFSRGHAAMTYGKIGVKVWIYKGEVFDKDKAQKDQKKA
jgi:small subunit ribosomal protein S3